MERGKSSVIGTLAGASFAVYLLHEHMDLRYVWQQWLMVDKQAESVWFPVLMAGSIVSVFIVCAVIEIIRQKIFRKVGEVVGKKK